MSSPEEDLPKTTALTQQTKAHLQEATAAACGLDSREEEDDNDERKK